MLLRAVVIFIFPGWQVINCNRLRFRNGFSILVSAEEFSHRRFSAKNLPLSTGPSKPRETFASQWDRYPALPSLEK